MAATPVPRVAAAAYCGEGARIVRAVPVGGYAGRLVAVVPTLRMAVPVWRHDNGNVMEPKPPTPSLPAATLISRLSLPRFMLREAERAMERGGPYGHALAISLLHDAVEIFLRVLAEAEGADIQPQAPFMELVKKVADAQPIVSGHRYALDKLNRVRVEFKHRGIRATNEEDARVILGHARDFLVDLSADALNVDFQTVSLRDAIEHRRTRKWIENAVVAQSNDQFDDLARWVAGGVAIYVDHCQVVEARHRHDRFRTIDWIETPPYGHLYVADEHLASIAEWATRVFLSLHERIYLLERGVDMAQYEKFARLTPRVAFSGVGQLRFVGWNQGAPSSPEEATFCIDFAVEAVLALQGRLTALGPVPVGKGPRARVLRDCDVFAVPPRSADDGEVIRNATVGETLTLPDNTWHYATHAGYVAVLQDDSVAFVPEGAVDAKPNR